MGLCYVVLWLCYGVMWLCYVVMWLFDLFAGNAMEELNFGDLHLNFIDDNLDTDRDTASVCSSLSAGLASSKSCIPHVSLTSPAQC